MDWLLKTLLINRRAVRRLVAQLRRLRDERGEGALRLLCVPLVDERVLEQLGDGRAPPGILLEAPRHEVPELLRRRGRRLRRLAEAYGAHEGGPVRPLAGGEEREVAQVKLEDCQPEAPHVGGVRVVVAGVALRVEPLRGHVGGRADVGRAGVETPPQNLAGAEIRNLDLAGCADEYVGRLEVAVHDAERVHGVEAEERLARDGGDRALLHGAAELAEEAGEGASAHELERQRCRLLGRGRRDHGVEADDVRHVGGEHEDLGLAGGGGLLGGEELEREGLRCPAVARLVDGAAVALAEEGDLLVVGEAGRVGGG
ncbi:unnamed protein product [Alopecurus aequalis]